VENPAGWLEDVPHPAMRCALAAGAALTLSMLASGCAVTGAMLRVKCAHDQFVVKACVMYPHLSRKKAPKL
jgi:hypothetical protein